jgi:hypothetical protein
MQFVLTDQETLVDLNRIAQDEGISLEDTLSALVEIGLTIYNTREGAKRRNTFISVQTHKIDDLFRAYRRN